MSQDGPGANHHEKEIRFAGGCLDSPECEFRAGNDGKLLTKTALAPFICEEVVIRYRDREDQSAGVLVVLKLPLENMNETNKGLQDRGNVRSEVKKNKKTVSRKSQWSKILNKWERMMTKLQ